MRILVITNLFPPQELGGYGRCLADFVWGLKELGHYIKVLTSDAPYLNSHSSTSQSYVNPDYILRSLQLKGSYESGISILTNEGESSIVDDNNIALIHSCLSENFDGVLLGNLDLIGFQILPCLLSFNIPILHHIGFVNPPFTPHPILDSDNYHILPASDVVGVNLRKQGFSVNPAHTVYPGARTDLFQLNRNHISSSLSFALSQHHAGFCLGKPSNPLKVGYAGLIMSSKGVHTIIESVITLRNHGLSIQATLAGAPYQKEYYEKLLSIISDHDCTDMISFVGPLSRPQLIRFWDSQHVGIFPSIYPEAFGISAAEILSSGLLLLSTGVGGASELFTSGVHGLSFKPDNSSSLYDVISYALANPDIFKSISTSGNLHVRKNFSVLTSARKLEHLFSSLHF